MLDFKEIPILDWSLSQTDKPLFLTQLRHAMINVGFLYLKNHPVSPELIDRVTEFVPKFFALPQPAKDEVDMSNSAHFHGYLKVGGKVQREHFNFGGDRTCEYKDGRPEYLKLHGDALWPDEALIPGFRQTILTYYELLEDLSYEFTERVSEALGLPSDALNAFFDPDRKKLQPRCKLLYYPPSPLGATDGALGHGAHVDRSFLTFLLQASDNPGLEVKNLAGEWIPVPPIKHTFVINLGIALEKATHRVAIATTHRVLSPIGKPRYSIPFFSSLAMNVRLADVQLEFPEEVLDMKRARDERTGDKTEFQYTEKDYLPAGVNVLEEKLKFHPITTQRFYPTLFDKYFPNGIPANAKTATSAY